MKTRVIRETCIACGNCYGFCPEVYDCDEEGIAFSLLEEENIDNKLIDKVFECQKLCPTDSIIIKEEDFE